jgi:hypothetical protein
MSGGALSRSGPTEMERRLTEALDAALTGLDAAQEKLAAAEAERDAAVRRRDDAERLAAERDQLIREISRQMDQQLTGMSQRAEAARQQWDAERARLAAQAAAAEQVQRDLDAARQRLRAAEASVAQLAARLATGGDPAAHDAALAESASIVDVAQAVFVSLPARERERAPAVAGAPVSVPARADLAARQRAARTYLAEAAPRAGADEAVGRLLATLDVVLTRLELLDAADPQAARAFASLVRRTEAVERLDAALAAEGLPVALRAWLVKARLVLTGVSDG